MELHFNWLTPEIYETLPMWCDSTTLTVDQMRDLDTRSLVALDENSSIVAVAEWFTPKAHHSHYWLNIQVCPQHRRQGIGTEVFRLASSLRNSNLPFTARDYMGTPAMAFADHLGAYTQQVVPLQRAKTENLKNLRVHPSVIPFSEVNKEQFQNAYLSMYEWTHKCWAPVSGDHQQRITTDALEDMIEEATFVSLTDSGSIDGFVAAYWDNDQPLLIGETVQRNALHGEHILEGCLKK